MPLGVDLGTTNSSIAWVDTDGTVHSLSVRSGKEPFDAVLRTVVLDPTGDEPVVGHRAFEAHASRQEAMLLTSFKPKLDKQRLRRTAVRYERVTTGDYDFVAQGIGSRSERSWCRSSTTATRMRRLSRPPLMFSAGC